MKKCRFAYLLLVALAALPAAAIASSEMVIENLEKVSHKVVYVNSFGDWSEGDDSGYYRVILLDSQADFPHSKIYIQWIAEKEERDDTVVATASVAEVNNVGVFKLSVPKISKGDDGNAVEVTAVNQYSHAVQNLQIIPGDVSSYTLLYISEPYSKVVDSAVSQIPMSLDYYVRPTF